MSMIENEIFWAWGTLALSTMIAMGYGVIAFNWFFQTKLAKHAEARAALGRLRGICVCCVICGTTLYLTDMPWALWRVYDCILAVVAIRTWIFLIQMRGWSFIDERLAQVAELERSETKYRQIAELLPHIVWTANAHGWIEFSNQRWHEYAGDCRSWLDAAHPDEKAEAQRRWNEAIASRQPFNLEVRLMGIRGYRTFVVKATPIMQGEAIKWLGACADIEDQKLLAAEKDLQARQKSFFLNALSHDLRAPLHNVLLNAHVLKLSARQPQDAESVDMIVENAMAAGDLVTKLLDFAKVGAKDDNVVETLSLEATLAQLVRRFAPVAEQKGLYLRLETGGEVVVATDRQKLERIVSNLVDNAIKYTSVGGVTIELSQTIDQVCVRVRDTGMGIPPQNVAYLFDEFYQVNNYERDRAKGFGMGLAICKCLAHHLGGDVRLADTSGEGSCFEFSMQIIGIDRGRRSGGAERHRTAAADGGICRV